MKIPSLFKSAAQSVNKMSPEEVDKFISDKDPARLSNYNMVRWKHDRLDWETVGLWCGNSGAKGLPADWCFGSLRETSEIVDKAVKGGTLAMRAKDVDVAVRGMMKIVDFLIGQQILHPIVLPGNAVRTNPQCKSLSWGFDDGNMRAITFTLVGHRDIPAYVGST